MERFDCVVVCATLAIFLLPAAYNGQFPTPTLTSCTDLCDGQVNASSTCLDLDCGDGTCVQVNDTTAECMCSPGLGGRNCSVELNLCDSQPCLNGGTCRDGIVDNESGFECLCPPAYDGLRCEIETICRNQCLNGGTCMESIVNQQPTCQCPNNFTGSFCEEPINIDFSGCRAGVDPVWNFTWVDTEFNSQDMQTCPGGEGIAVRLCGSQGWEEADVTQCQSDEFIDFSSQANSVFADDETGLENQLEQTAAITRDLNEATMPRGGLSLLPGDLNSTNEIIVGVLGLLESTLDDDNITHVAPQNLLSIFSNVLDADNLIGWETLQEVDAGSQLLLDNVERYANYLANALEDSERQMVQGGNNLVIGWSRISPSNNERSIFPESVNDLVDAGFDSIPAQVSIPAGLLGERRRIRDGESTVPVTNVLFRNMEAVLPTGPTTSVASMVISTTVSDREFQGQQSQALLAEPVEVTFTFNEVENGTGYRCAFWEFSNPVGNGRWSSDGVETYSATSQNGEMTVECRSVHLSSFAVLVDVSGTLSDLNGVQHREEDLFANFEMNQFDDDNEPAGLNFNDDNAAKVDSAELQALMVVSYIGCGISMACLVIAIVFFLTLGKKLLLMVHYFIHLNLAISLFVGYLVFVIGIQTARHSMGGCVFVTVLLHYFFLAAFCWMLCEGIMLYLMLVVVFSRLSKKWWFFLLIGWGLPILPVVIGVAARHNDYGVRNDDGMLIYCWLSTDNGVIWAFVGPMLAIIAVNVFFMTVALVQVYRSTKSKAAKQGTNSKYKENKELFVTLFRASVILLPILGLTWVFGLFTVNRNLTVFAWLFTILNSLQGVFIFLFHVLRSEKVWQSSRVKSLRSKASSTFRSTVKSSSASFTTVRKGYTVSTGSKSEGKVISEKYQSMQEGSSELVDIASSGWSSAESEHPNEQVQAFPEDTSLVVIPNTDVIDDTKIDVEAGSQDCS